jgi:hypothetical protein
MVDNPALTAEAIAEFKDSLECSEAEKRARLYGDFESMGNRVLYNFDRDHHVVKPFAIPEGWVHGLTVDPHHVRPAYCVWWAFDPCTKVYHFYREWPNRHWPGQTTGGKTPSEYATLFRETEGRDPARIRLADPAFAKQEHTIQGRKFSAWAKAMEECGMPFTIDIPDTRAVETGEQKIVEMFKFDHSNPLSPNNCPKIQIHETCTNLIKACESYNLLPARDRTILREKRSEEWKDPIDTMRYTVLYEIPPHVLWDDVVIDPFNDSDWAQMNEWSLYDE